jgi:hypothetical protein
MGILSWKSIATYLATQQPGYAMRVASHRVEHPLDGGLHPTVTLPIGQRGDYRTPVQGGYALHVYDFDRYYVAILESAQHPSAPQAIRTGGDATGVATGVAIGSLLGLLLGRTAGSAVAGGALGALLGAASRSENYRRGLSDRASRPAISSGVKKAVEKSNSTPSGRTRGGRKRQL